MAERIFTMKGTGNELPAKWNGVTIPLNIPDFDEKLAGIVEHSGAKNAYTLWARAELLDAQKEIKAHVLKHPDVTVEDLRKFAAGRRERLRAAELKLRDPNAEPKSQSSGVVKEAKQAQSALEKMIEKNPAVNVPLVWDDLPDGLKIKYAEHAPSGATIPAPKPVASKPATETAASATTSAAPAAAPSGKGKTK